MPADAMIRLREAVSNLLARRGHGGPFADDEPLFSSGRLDSLSATEMLLLLEGDFGVDLADPDFDIASLDTLRDMAALVEGSRSSALACAG